MIQELLKWRKNGSDHGFDGHMILTIHDELVFDFPWVSNRAPDDYSYLDSQANRLRVIMESASDGIGIPIKVSVERHVLDWSSGEVIPRVK